MILYLLPSILPFLLISLSPFLPPSVTSCTPIPYLPHYLISCPSPSLPSLSYSSSLPYLPPSHTHRCFMPVLPSYLNHLKDFVSLPSFLHSPFPSCFPIFCISIIIYSYFTSFLLFPPIFFIHTIYSLLYLPPSFAVSHFQVFLSFLITYHDPSPFPSLRLSLL